MVTDKPLFKSLDQALRWAYRYQPETRHTSALSRLMGSTEDTENMTPRKLQDPYLDSRPAGLDASAQVGLIKSFVSRQEDPDRLHLLAKYAGGQERHAARRALRDWVIPFMDTTLRPRRAIYELVCIYYGKPMTESFRELGKPIVYLMPKQQSDKKRLDAAETLIGELNRKVENILKGLTTRVEEKALDDLRKLRVVE